MQILVYVYIIVAVITFTGLEFIDFLGHRKENEARDEHYYDPKVLVIIPCKGIDLDLDKNLSSIAKQKEVRYDTVAVVDSEEDIAINSIKKAGINHIVAGSICTRCSGKVKAISTAIEQLREYDVYVIADSDIRVDRLWLRLLIDPLKNKKIGLSTMFPYFKPTGGFWSVTKCVWGFVGDSMMESQLTRFGWGGSLAFRKGLLDPKSMKFFKDSRYSVSDDICLTKIAKEKGLKIAYTKEHRPVVNVRESASSFIEWANRQTALTVMSDRKTLRYGLLYYGSETLVLLSGIVLAISVSPIFIIMLIHLGRSIFLNYKRARFKSLTIALITIAMPMLYLISLVAASRIRSITWRGRIYKLG